ncbi:MAG: efflux RND transporter periplasmic adaptor subunit, partial [Pseudomonadota bacterium]
PGVTKAPISASFVTPGMQLGDIYASDIVDVPIPLTDRDLASLGLGIGFLESPQAPGPEVQLSATIADTPHTWTGRVSRTDSAFDPATRVLFAYVTVDDPYGAGADDGTPLATGLFVSAEMTGRQLVDGIVIPRTALRGNDMVFVAQPDDTLEMRSVQVASSTRERAVLTSGLAVGERVITSPVRGAANGMKIKTVDRIDVAATDTPASDNTTN